MDLKIEDIRDALQGVIPSMIVTTSKEGIPNIAYVSQVFFVNNQQVAISHQFFNKSIRNLQENPQVCVNIVSPVDGKSWKMELVFSHSETEGDLFDSMAAQLEGIATMMGMEDVFNLKAAEVFDVVHIAALN